MTKHLVTINLWMISHAASDNLILKDPYPSVYRPVERLIADYLLPCSPVLRLWQVQNPFPRRQSIRLMAQWMPQVY